MLQNLIQFEASKLSPYLFGILSVYVIYALIYQRLVMLPFQNNKTGEREYQEYAGSIVFFQQLFAWVCVEFYVYSRSFSTSTKDEINKIPWKQSCLFGILKFLAIILFTEGLYATNFRFAFAVRSAGFAAGSLLGVLYPIMGGSFLKKSKMIDILLGLFMLGGMILFWVYDPQICFYVPIQPRVIGAVMIIFSVLIECVLSIVQSQYTQIQNINPIILQRDVMTWTLTCSYFYIAFNGQFSYAVDYTYKHLEYFIEVVFLGALHFLAQLIIYKAIKSLSQNTSDYLISASMVLIVQISFAFSVHKYHHYQVIGMGLAWFGIGAVFIGRIPKNNHDKKSDIQKESNPYEQIQVLQNEEID